MSGELQQSEPAPSARRLSVCAAHGLRFDPARASGCVLCQRSLAPAAPPAPALQSSWIWLAVAGVVAVGVLAVVAQRLRKPLDVAAPTADPVRASPLAEAPSSPTRAAEPDQQWPPSAPARPALHGSEFRERECDAGKADACWSLGYAAAEKQDRAAAYDAYRRAVLIYDKACDQKDHQACVKMAYAYRDGLGVTRDPRRANEYMNKAMGNPEGAKLLDRPTRNPPATLRTAQPLPASPPRKARPLSEWLNPPQR